MACASVLVGALFGFLHARLGPSLFGFGLFLGDLPLSVGLLALGDAFPLQFLVARERTGGLFDLPLHALDGPRKCRFRSAVFSITHGSHSVRLVDAAVAALGPFPGTHGAKPASPVTEASVTSRRNRNRHRPARAVVAGLRDPPFNLDFLARYRRPMTTPPRAVLLDSGGIFLLPQARRIVAAFRRAEVEVDPGVLHDAHYRAAQEFGTELDVDADWSGSWKRYLSAYVDACAVGDAERNEVHRHLDSEFADAALWLDVIPGAADGLRALAATGVILGVVSNADGVMAQRLDDLGMLQVGAGAGVEVACVIDSGAVGVMKPDPRIFAIALEAIDVKPEDAWYVGDMPAFDVVGARRAGLRPFLMDPLGLHHAADYDRIGSLSDLADQVTAG